MVKRKVIQIAASARAWGALDAAAKDDGGISAREVDNLYALCDDGTVWAFVGDAWRALPPISQSEPE